MRVLVLGETAFLGRHIVEHALTRGDEVTIFNRGRTARPHRPLRAADRLGAAPVPGVEARRG